MVDVVSCYSSQWKPSLNRGSLTNGFWQIANESNTDIKLINSESDKADLVTLIDVGGQVVYINSDVKLDLSSVKNSQFIQVDFLTKQSVLDSLVGQWSVDSLHNFTQSDMALKGFWKGIMPVVDIANNLVFDQLNNLTLVDTFKFDSSFISLGIAQKMYWDYGLSNFVVGGITSVPSVPVYNVVESPNGEIIEHINYEVYNVVNTVNMTVQPSNVTINFSNFRIQRDIESFAWTVTFDVLDKTSFNLIRPQGRTLKTIDIDINTESFTVVVAKGSIQRKQGSASYQCSGWSKTKLLAYPYANKRSFTDSQARTAAQIVSQELVSTGFTYTWDTVDWLVPLGVHSYQDKTPMGAILEVCNAVGAVIVPHVTDNSFDVQPYYPVSPWSWGSATVDRTMFESQFFETSSETIPKENPDGVFVYGTESSGVGVKVVRNGFPGTALLPDVVDKYITMNVVGQERGRVEVSKNSFIERIPMTTYIDESGIIMPQELIEFTDLDDETWRGMVLSTSISCERVGTALSQTIVVARFYE